MFISIILLLSACCLPNSNGSPESQNAIQLIHLPNTDTKIVKIYLIQSKFISGIQLIIHLQHFLYFPFASQEKPCTNFPLLKEMYACISADSYICVSVFIPA